MPTPRASHSESERGLPIALVVEDDWAIRQVLSGELRQAGWTVLEAEGVEALVFLRDGRRIDVLITDIRLPGSLTGWDIAEAYRAAEPEMPVIYTSSSSSSNPRRVAKSWFFAKPYQAVRVVETAARSIGLGAG